MREILERLMRGEIGVHEAERLIRQDLIRIGDYAVLDVNREARTGCPEIVLADGKTPEQISKIVYTLVERGHRTIISRLDVDGFESLRHSLPQEIKAVHHPVARVAVVRPEGFTPPDPLGTIGVMTGGTSDVPVAEEASFIASELGCAVKKAYDVGVAAIKRILCSLNEMGEVDVYVVAAGREGALPTVVAGLVDRPVIGLPVSTGYGAGGSGISALQAMLQSCSPILVVNIDAGVIAGVMAARIARLCALRRG